MPKLKINLNLHDEMLDDVHGRHKKELIVLHETVSSDIVGMADITSVADYLDRIDYGIHGIVDRQGYVAWALGLGNAIFWHAGGENDRGIGIELVSPIPSLLANRAITKAEAESLWKDRKFQLNRTAQLVACISRAHDIPLSYVHNCCAASGVTAHWNVSQRHPESDGHTDCWPIQENGYFPINYVIWKARYYKSLGYRF